MDALNSSTRQVRTVHYFGCCPKCQQAPVHVNVGKLNAATCPACRLVWVLGYGLFSAAEGMTSDECEAEMGILRTYEQIEPPDCAHFRFLGSASV